jgi:competence protein ComEC
MIFATFCFVSGVMILQNCSDLPELAWAAPASLAALTLFRRRNNALLGWILLGWAWALVTAGLAMQEQLDQKLEGRDLRVRGKVIGMPQHFDRAVVFGFEIDEIDGVADQSFPRKVRLSWYSPEFKLRAGEIWRFEVSLKRPHGTRNPGGFDYEQWLYLQGYRATGYVRHGFAALRLDRSARNFSVDRGRQSIAERLSASLETSSVGGIIRALVVGERDKITAEQWEVFRKTGTAHLVAISGLHIGLVAGLGFATLRWFWVRVGSLRLPAPSVAAGFAIVCALIYAALAGFSVPTQRALIMISLFMGGILLRRNRSPGHTLAIALFLIVLSDPASVLSPGLWLSFSAVSLIAYVVAGRIGRTRGWTAMQKIHLVSAVGLSPLLLLYFQQVSLIAPLANLVAVPVVSLVIVPLSLCGSLLMLILPQPGIAVLGVGAFALEMLWHYLEWLAALPFAQWSSIEPSILILAVAAAGLLLFFAPRGIPARWLAVPMLLPLVFSPVNPPFSGRFRFTLLDVGQGLAAVVETENRTLVFDTGARFSDRFNMGAAVVAPFLRSRNIHLIDRLVVSHADNDHLGGARSLNRLFPIDRIDTSTAKSIDWRTVTECKAGQSWNWDGVDFRMLAPFDQHSDRRNDNSCVLKVSSGSHSILLTGDIEKNTEVELVERYGPLLASDYLVVAHHGSNTSSTARFLEAVRPKYALIPAGYRNRYGFPRPEVVERLVRVGAKIFTTAESGAISLALGPGTTTGIPRLYRTEARKYYHFHAAARTGIRDRACPHVAANATGRPRWCHPVRSLTKADSGGCPTDANQNRRLASPVPIGAVLESGTFRRRARFL